MKFCIPLNIHNNWLSLKQYMHQRSGLAAEAHGMDWHALVLHIGLLLAMAVKHAGK